MSLFSRKPKFRVRVYLRGNPNPIELLCESFTVNKNLTENEVASIEWKLHGTAQLLYINLSEIVAVTSVKV